MPIFHLLKILPNFRKVKRLTNHDNSLFKHFVYFCVGDDQSWSFHVKTQCNMDVGCKNDVKIKAMHMVVNVISVKTY